VSWLTTGRRGRQVPVRMWVMSPGETPHPGIWHSPLWLDQWRRLQQEEYLPVSIATWVMAALVAWEEEQQEERIGWGVERLRKAVLSRNRLGREEASDWSVVLQWMRTAFLTVVFQLDLGWGSSRTVAGSGRQ
jgi:hypothetical protein